MNRFSEVVAGASGLAAPWRSPSAVRRYQAARLRDLVRHCWREVPVYQCLWESAGVDPTSFRGCEDLSRLPLMQRSTLRDAQADDVIARSRRDQKLKIRRTSGSSGAPLTIRRSWFEDWLLRGFRLQSELLQGDHPFRYRFTVGAAGPGMGLKRYRVTKTSHADCLEPMPQIVAKLLATNPNVVAGYSGSIAALAAALPEEARRRLHVRSVYTGAETMTPAMRETVQAAFGVRPLTVYASHEFNLIASECPQTGLMHVAEGAVIVEVLDDGRPVKEGEQGQTVITALHSYAMPFVRYCLGDWVTRGPDRCPCGAPCSTIAEVQGRVMEVFPLPGGRQLHPYAIIRPMLKETAIRQYQIIQEELNLIRVRLVGLERATPDQKRGLAARLGEVCGPEVRVELEAVEEIRPEANRKYRPYESWVTRKDR